MSSASLAGSLRGITGLYLVFILIASLIVGGPAAVKILNSIGSGLYNIPSEGTEMIKRVEKSCSDPQGYVQIPPPPSFIQMTCDNCKDMLLKTTVRTAIAGVAFYSLVAGKGKSAASAEKLTIAERAAKFAETAKKVLTSYKSVPRFLEAASLAVRERGLVVATQDAWKIYRENRVARQELRTLTALRTRESFSEKFIRKITGTIRPNPQGTVLARMSPDVEISLKNLIKDTLSTKEYKRWKEAYKALSLSSRVEHRFSQYWGYRTGSHRTKYAAMVTSFPIEGLIYEASNDLFKNTEEILNGPRITVSTGLGETTIIRKNAITEGIGSYAVSSNANIISSEATALWNQLNTELSLLFIDFGDSSYAATNFNSEAYSIRHTVMVIEDYAKEEDGTEEPYLLVTLQPAHALKFADDFRINLQTALSEDGFTNEEKAGILQLWEEDTDFARLEEDPWAVLHSAVFLHFATDEKICIEKIRGRTCSLALSALHRMEVINDYLQGHCTEEECTPNLQDYHKQLMEIREKVFEMIRNSCSTKSVIFADDSGEQKTIVIPDCAVYVTMNEENDYGESTGGTVYALNVGVDRIRIGEQLYQIVAMPLAGTDYTTMGQMGISLSIAAAGLAGPAGSRAFGTGSAALSNCPWLEAEKTVIICMRNAGIVQGLMTGIGDYCFKASCGREVFCKPQVAGAVVVESYDTRTEIRGPFGGA